MRLSLMTKVVRLSLVLKIVKQCLILKLVEFVHLLKVAPLALQENFVGLNRLGRIAVRKSRLKTVRQRRKLKIDELRRQLRAAA